MEHANILVTGGSGSGKTYRYARDCILQCNADYFVTTTNLDYLNVTDTLYKAGYEIMVLDCGRKKLPEQPRIRRISFDPLRHAKDETDLSIIASTLIEQVGGRQFWANGFRTVLSRYLETTERADKSLAGLFRFCATRPEEIESIGGDGFGTTLLCLLQPFSIAGPWQLEGAEHYFYQLGSGDRPRALFLVMCDTDSTLQAYWSTFVALAYKEICNAGAKHHVRFVLDDSEAVAIPTQFQYLLRGSDGADSLVLSFGYKYPDISYDLRYDITPWTLPNNKATEKEPDVKRAGGKRRVRCVETGEEFESVSAAAKRYKTRYGNIYYAAKKRGTTVGYHWEFF